MKLRMLIYNSLVNRHPAIQKRYYRLRAEKPGLSGRLYAWFSLLRMNVSWALGNHNLRDEEMYPDEKKKTERGFVESAGAQELTAEQLALKLSAYDVISFDIFDTLIFRTFVAPTDLFFAVGQKLDCMDFENIRRIMEWRAREKKFKKAGNYEITLEDIYREMELQAGIPADKGMETELETELEYTFGNPYMLEVFRILEREKKDCRIICTSDMYLPSQFLRKMLEKAGFHNVERIFVSCEEDASKSDRRLYEKVKACFPGAKMIHVGDNPESDRNHAKEAGWDAHLYRNVSIAGMPYRAEDLSIITGSLYRGIVNAGIHNGLKTCTADYELGYIYGGFFVLGYCQFIHKMALDKKWDKILFLSRDGDIVKQVYDKLYGEIPTEYVYWSRTAATKMGARYFKFDFLRRFIDHKVNQGYTIKSILESAELSDMLPELVKTFPQFVAELVKSDAVFGMSESAMATACREAEITEDTTLSEKNAWLLREYFIANWEQIAAHYDAAVTAGGKYYGKVLAGCKNVAAVDVGWAGSGALVLRKLVSEAWGMDCSVTGVIAGTNTYNNTEPNAAEQFLYTGELISYLYSQENNREYWKWHNPGKDHNLVVELLLSSTEGSFKGFYPDATNENGYRLLFKKPDANPDRVREIQAGILDFVQEYQKLVPENYKQQHLISGSDAYAVLKVLLQSKIDIDLEMGI